MTEQYAKRNINDPAGSRTQANAVGDPDFAITGADVGKLLLLDTTAVAGAATLPLASSVGAGAEITIVAVAGSTFALTLAANAADTLIVPTAGTNPAASDNASFIVRCDGVDTWYVVAGLV